MYVVYENSSYDEEQCHKVEENCVCVCVLSSFVSFSIMHGLCVCVQL